MSTLSRAKLHGLLLTAVILAAGNLHAASIQYDVTGVGSSPLGNPIYRFTYMVTGWNFLTNQELAIRFDPALYGALSNPSAPAGFDVVLFQPNNPPGSVGLYSALALIDGPSLATPFRVNAVYLGQGTPPRQDFVINQYNPTGGFRVVDSGMTVFSGQVPEPATFATVGVILGLIGCSRKLRLRFRRNGCS